MYTDFKNKVQEKSRGLQELENSLLRCKKDIQKISVNKSELEREQGKLQLEAETHEMKIQERDQRIVDLNIQGYSEGPFSVGRANEALEELKKIFAAKATEGKNGKAEFKGKIDETDTRIKQLEKELNTYESEITQKRKLMSDNQRRIQQIAQELHQVG